MKPLIAFDEAGNSGGNLLDPEQPTFVLASVHLSDEETDALLPPRAGEYKFATLKRSAPGRQAILDCLNSPILAEDRHLVSGFHKKFMAVTKMVDMLVEPLTHRDGINLYERGANIGLSNLWFYTMPVFLGRDVFDMLIERFVQMVREPSIRTIQKFYQLVDTAYRLHQKESYAGDFAVLLTSRPIAESSIDDWDGSDLDPAIPAFFEHGAIWTERLNTPFSIVHDASKPIENEQIILEAMMSETEERVRIGFDRRKMLFPIAAKEIELRDSKLCRQLQVADLIASSVAHCLKTSILKKDDEFAKALLTSSVLNGSFKPLWPEMKITPEELGTEEVGGIDPNDHVGDYVADRLGGIPAKGQRRKV
jgi:hypothetical protein